MDDRISPERVIDEMAKLRRGRGLDADDAADKVGPALRLLCRVDDDDDPTVVRDKIGELFTRTADVLPEDLRITFLAAFGLITEARHVFFQDRLRWAGDRFEREERTVRRRLDDACKLVAERAIAQYRQVSPAGDEQQPSKEWYTEALYAVLCLDQPTPEAFEVRRIAAEQDDVRQIDLAVTVSGPTAGSPADPPGLEMDVIFGGTLVRRRMASTRRFGLSLALPVALGKGDVHTFAMRFRLPSGDALLPHFVCATEQRCDLMDIRVKFAEKRPPTAVWQVTRVFQGEVQDPAHRGGLVPLDAANEVRVRFRGPQAGFAYGVQWNEQTDVAGDAMR
ncbi:MAG TPA: hypothetical protein VH333_26705 [Pseudonocardiaceae bacterium]|jgi:hypothetical protein|nr:hypothetical protein [Pseudonocardiaceae bacterium]